MIEISCMTMDKVRSKVGWVCGLFMLGLLAVGPSTVGAAGDVEKGKDIYRESCRHCHGFSGQGDGEMAEYLNPRPANLTSQTTQAKTDQELQEVILKGRTGTSMVGFEGALEEAQLKNLLAFIRSLKP